MRAIFKKARQRSWPGLCIVHGAPNKQPANGTNHIRLAPERAAAHSVKRPIMVSKHGMAADRQNDQPERQERYRFNHPDKRTPNQGESICGHTRILAGRCSLGAGLRGPQPSAQKGGSSRDGPPGGGVARLFSVPLAEGDELCARGSGVKNWTESTTNTNCERVVPSSLQVSVRQRPSTIRVSPFAWRAAASAHHPKLLQGTNAVSSCHASVLSR